MARWFGERWFGRPGPPAESDRLNAYKEGRADEHARLRDRTLDPAAAAHDTRAAANEAYERGRREERLRHRGSPLMMFIVLALVVIGLIVLILAVRAGSFQGAGQQIDAAVRQPVQTAADKAGSALQDAGQTIKNKAGSTAQPTQPAQ